MPNKQNPDLIPNVPNIDSQNLNSKDLASKNSTNLNFLLLRYRFQLMSISIEFSINSFFV